ncbi:MAG: amino acid permease [Sulfolobaceae archaeon]|nr:amino acid permease [Sulfolobaceae archaeon]
MTSKSLFIRESSGLIKQVNLIDAVMLNLGNMSVGAALFESISPYISPGGVLWLAALIGLVFAIPQLILYTILTQKIGRTGGDYVWISRALGGGIGSTLALAFMLEATAYFALISFFSASSINAVLFTIGTTDKIPGLVYLSNTVFVNPYAGSLTLTQRLIFYGISAAAFAILIGLNIVSAKLGYKIVTGLGVFSLLSTVLAMIVIGINSPDFIAKITPFITAANISVPSSVLTSKSFLPSSISLTATLALLPLFAIYTYPWMNAGPAVAAELKGQKTLKLNIVLAVLITGVLAIGSFALMDYAAGYNFNLNAYPSFIYNFWTAAMAVAGNPVLQWIIGLGSILWNYFILAYGVLVFSRYIFALSFDRVLPEKFTELNRKGSPVYAHSLDLILTLLLLLIPVFSINAALALYGASIVAMLYFVFVSLAGIVIGKKEGYRGLLIAGALSLIYFAYLTYLAATNPLFGFVTSNGTVNPVTALFVGVGFLGSALVYVVSKHIRMKKGIDLSLVFKEIPPE